MGRKRNPRNGRTGTAGLLFSSLPFFPGIISCVLSLDALLVLLAIFVCLSKQARYPSLLFRFPAEDVTRVLDLRRSQLCEFQASPESVDNGGLMRKVDGMVGD